MKKIVLINIDFKDAYTDKLHKAGDKAEMTDARITEIKSVNPDFVSVIGSVDESEQTNSKTAGKKTDDKAAKNSK